MKFWKLLLICMAAIVAGLAAYLHEVWVVALFSLATMFYSGWKLDQLANKIGEDE